MLFSIARPRAEQPDSRLYSFGFASTLPQREQGRLEPLEAWPE
jgi:hypothetical protein